MPKVSLALKALRSACIPAPPEQSEPATDKHFNILYSFLMEKGKQKNLLTMQEVNLHKLLPTLVLTNRFKGSGFTFSTQLFAWVPLQTLFDFFAVFLLFFIITLVSEIVKEKLCRYRKYYRANKIGLSRAPAPTFTFENLPIQLFDSLLCRKIALLYSILLIVFIFPQYLIFARGCILIP